jgi:UDP-2,3-diacylglucosamine pyrophosphatase LpxH
MAIEEALKDEVTLKNLFMQVMLHEKPLEWKECMDVVSIGPGTLGEEDGTLQLALSRMKDEKEIFRDVARAELSKKEVHVVILGHTHTPDQEVIEGGKQYFNPGSWTRFADLSTQKDLKLDDLRDESKYPYQLNYIWVELKGEDVRGQLKTYRELKPQK